MHRIPPDFLPLQVCLVLAYPIKQVKSTCHKYTLLLIACLPVDFSTESAISLSAKSAEEQASTDSTGTVHV